jgi:hypothetical protein
MQVWYAGGIGIWCTVCRTTQTILNLMSAATGGSVELSKFHALFQLQITTSIWVVLTLRTCVAYTVIPQLCVIKRWWLKLFFYLLDVGTSNALVLHNKFARMRATDEMVYSPMNIVDFKMQQVESLVGKWMDNQDVVEEVEHVPVHIPGGIRSRCAYCALLSRTHRTRYKCIGCGVPLCSIGSGKVDNNCFAQAHETKERQILVCKKYQAMQKRTTSKNKV